MSVPENDKSITDPRSEFLAELKNAVSTRVFVRIVLGKGRVEGGAERGVGEILEGGEGRIRVVYSYQRREETKVYSPAELVAECESVVGTSFFSATLHTTVSDIGLDYSRKGVPRLDRRKPTYTGLVSVSHNREKERFINPNTQFLKELGISDSEGRVRPDKYDKYRQIDKFLEIVDGLYRESSLAKKKSISVVDIGSGKSYLTFALYEYFSHLPGITPVIRGVEIRDELVTFSNSAAKKCGYGGLSFVRGTVGEQAEKTADIVVALHACDTATDEALAYAIGAKASIIVCAPCCHKYVRKNFSFPDTMEPILRHGILEERFAESLTDSLRALALEANGYRSKVFEFISLEHTSKNTMITGVRGGADVEKARTKIERVKKEFGLKDFYLDKLL